VPLSASTSEAYQYLFKLLGDTEDEVLALRPSYPLFEFLATMESLRAVSYPLTYDGA
jgi:aspartate/methionine/tyrosine aminotransferase